MQPTIGPKHVLFTHMWATVLVLGILLSGALGLTGLAVTGNLPWTTHTSRTVASSSLNPASLRAEQVKQQAAFFDAKLARLEADGLHAATQVARTAAHATLLQFYARKEERLLAFSTPAAAASHVQTIHGLDRADAIAVLHASARHQDAVPGRQHIDAPCAVLVSNAPGTTLYDVWQCATERAADWQPTPDGCSCPPVVQPQTGANAESWTLLDDLTPVRVWQ